MKTRLVLAGLFAVSIGAVANAAQTTPPQTPPTSTRASMMNDSETSDEAIVTKVKQQLTTHGLSSDDISVTFQDGTATLSGNVARHEDIEKAKSAALKVRGVKKVDTFRLETQADKR